MEKNPSFGFKSEIHEAKFGVFITYIFVGRIWGSNKNFRGKFWGQALDLLIWKYPPGTPQNAVLGIVEDESYETDDFNLINHILLTFKHSLYNRRDAPTSPNNFYVKERLKLVQKTEYKMAKDRNTLGLWEKLIPNSNIC